MFPATNPYPTEPVSNARDLYAKVVANNLGGPLPSVDRMAMWFAAGLTGWGIAGELIDTVQTAFERGQAVKRGRPMSRDEIWSRVIGGLINSPLGTGGPVIEMLASGYGGGDVAASEAVADLPANQQAYAGKIAQLFKGLGALNPRQVAGKVWQLLNKPESWLPDGAEWQSTGVVSEPDAAMTRPRDEDGNIIRTPEQQPENQSGGAVVWFVALLAGAVILGASILRGRR